MAIDRWAPWIEPEVACSGDFTVNNTTPTLITALTKTFTPDMDCRVALTAKADVVLTTAGTDNLIVRFRINTTLQTPQAVVNAGAIAANWRHSAFLAMSFLALKNTAYTVELYANLGTSTGTVYTIKITHSVLGPFIVMPRVWNP